jgi:hypothetical protein
VHKTPKIVPGTMKAMGRCWLLLLAVKFKSQSHYFLGQRMM